MRVLPLGRVVTALLAALSAACGGGEDLPVRHVLLVTMDTTRADHLSCYGSSRARTPALDALAREGVKFRDCTSAAATTLSSHASIMTGTYPHRHGAVRNGFVVHPTNQLLAESLKEAGFWCAAFLGSSALVARSGLDQGFDVYDDEFDQPIVPGGNDQAQRLAPSVTDAVLAHVDEVLSREGGDEAQLFLFAHYFDPHAPYAPPADLGAEYGATSESAGFEEIERAVRAQQQHAIGAKLGQQTVITQGLPEELTRPIASYPNVRDAEMARLYAAEVAFMDREIGRLLAGLASRGVLESTLVVVTADHGETFWEHGNFWNHGLWVSQTDVHVPLIVRLPHAEAAGVEIETPVSGVDLMPTILEAVGLRSDRTEDPGRGRSLLGAMRGDQLELRAVFSEATQPGVFLEKANDLAWAGARKPHAVRLGPWKMVRASYLGITQLFNLENDPDENVDLMAAGPLAPDAKAALDDLELAHAHWHRSAAPRASRYDPTQAASLSGLGYGDGRPGSDSGDEDDRGPGSDGKH